MVRKMYSRGGPARPRYVSAAEAARLLGCTSKTVYNRVGAGTLPGFECDCGRLVIRVTDIDRFLAWEEKEELEEWPEGEGE